MHFQVFSIESLKPWINSLKPLKIQQPILEIIMFLQQAKLTLTLLRGRRTLNSPPKTSSQTEGELIKKKEKEAMSLKEAEEEEESETDSEP
ncbi:hypothetical protein Tco_1551255 [Tanacetum coccineum]